MSSEAKAGADKQAIAMAGVRNGEEEEEAPPTTRVVSPRAPVATRFTVVVAAGPVRELTRAMTAKEEPEMVELPADMQPEPRAAPTALQAQQEPLAIPTP